MPKGTPAPYPEGFFERYPQIDQFVEYFVDNKRTTSDQSVVAYRDRVARWIIWCEGEFPGFKLVNMNLQHYNDYQRYLKAQKYAGASVAQFNSIIKMFCRWLKYTDQIPNDIVFNRQFITFKQTHKFFELLTPQQISLIRKTRGVPLEVAAYFEMSLCTGMRISEILQIRACDIRWDKKPNDLIDNGPSRYVVGTLPIYRDRIKTKRNRTRVAYISRIAGKLLEQLMERYGMERDANQPFFVYNKSHYGRRLCEWLDYALDRKTSKQRKLERDQGKIAEKPRRSTMHFDLNPEAFANPDYQKKVRKLQEFYKKMQDRLPHYAKELREISPDYQELRPFSPHAFRHIYACFMFYRNFHGERNNLERLSSELGHMSMISTRIYLTQFNLVSTDTSWATLWTGTSSDWRGLT